MNTRKATRLAAIAAAAVLVLTGCSSNNFRDVEGIPSRDPDKIEVYNNVDGHPNVVLVCIRGAAFATTTRDHEAILRVAEWDRLCPGAVTK